MPSFRSWPNTWVVLGKVMAPLAYQFHLRLAWLYRQMFASTADLVHLTRHGYELSLAAKPAQRASGLAVLPAAAGLIIPQGVQFTRGDGITFTTSAAVTATGATVSLPFNCDQAGSIGNGLPGDTVTAVSSDELLTYWLGSGLPLPAPVTWIATVDASGFGGGADGEQVEDFRARVLFRKQNPPGGGSVADWTRWAEAVPGVTGVTVDTFSNDVRRIWLCILMAARPNRIPTSSDIAAVQAAILSATTRPVTCRPIAVAPTPVPVTISITNLLPNTVAVQAAILIELQALFATRPFPASPNQPTTLPLALIDEAIGLAPGYVSHTRLAPTGDLTLAAAGQLPVLGPVLFI